MKHKVFYCWQSDLPNAANYSFIEKALENAVRSIREDGSIQIEPDIDRDTRGVPGAPDIANTIFAKISQSQAFVCDVSIINQHSHFEEGKGPKGKVVPRPTPNPNVLIELGYALKALGSSRIILVFNTAYGELEQLPFDLHTKRVVTYNMQGKPEEGADRATERKVLERRLEVMLRDILAEVEANQGAETPVTPTILGQVITAIENAQPSQASRASKFMEFVVSELDKLAPDFSRPSEGSEFDDQLIDCLDQTKALVIEFSQLTETIAAEEASRAAQALYKSFSTLLERYNAPPNFSGSYRTIDFDFYKFIAHELFVTLFSFLIRGDQWDLVADLLENEFIVRNAPRRSAEAMPFTYVSQHLQLLAHRNDRLHLNRISLHADLLNSRHTEGVLGQSVPMQQFMEADYLLFLRSQLEREKDSGWAEWRPWSALYLHYTSPSYLVKAKRRKYAERLLRPLGVSDIETMRTRLAERAPKLERFFGIWADVNPLQNINIQEIGSM